MSTASGTAAPRQTEVGWYLYGVVPAEAAAPEIAARPGVDPEHEVAVIVEGRLAGVTSRVSLDEFDEAALPQRLADAAWLERKIRAHEQVLGGVLETAPVVPCRFCTVYRSEADLRAFLSGRRAVLAGALARFEGTVELGVKAFLDCDRFAAGAAQRSEPVRALAERVSHSEGGRAYLESRRLEGRVRDELVRFGAELGGDLHERLLAVSEDGVRLPAQRPELSGRDEEMVFNGAYLARDRARFEREVASLADRHRSDGVELELTGPWPPYNFVPEELGGAS